MTSLAELLALRAEGLDETLARTGVDPTDRVPAGYGSLDDLEALGRGTGRLVFVRGDEVVLVHLGPPALGAIGHDVLLATVGTTTELQGRGDKQARVHVAPAQGVAWCVRDGAVQFVDLFPPTTLDQYQRTVYPPPPDEWY